jgi:hypothetical protein
MGASALEVDHLALDAIDQQPIGLDMRIAKTSSLPLQGMV